MLQADLADGGIDAQISAERSELVQLRRDKRREMENEILRRAAAYAAGSLR